MGGESEDTPAPGEAHVRGDPPVSPRVLALLTADATHRDPATGKMTILGVFNSLYAGEFPVTHPFLAIYFALTEGYGKVRLHVRIVDADEAREPILRGELECNFVSPLGVYEVSLPNRNVRFPRAGEYRLQVICGDEVLTERRLFVSQRGGGGGGRGPDPAA